MGNRNTKYTIEEVRELVSMQGYTMVDDIYINNDTKIKCLCDKHGEFEARLRHLKSGHGCKKCGFDKNRGESSGTWNGGQWKSDMMFRHLLVPWRKECLERVNYTCEITGKNGILNVHHMFPFKDILKYTLDEVCIEYKNSFGEYTREERDTIFYALIKNNEKMAQPIVMLKSLHKKFHKFCGGNKKPTSFEQLAEFKRLVKEGVISA